MKCKHCGLRIVRRLDPWAERLYGRPALYVHDDLVDVSGAGVECPDGETEAEPSQESCQESSGNLGATP